MKDNCEIVKDLLPLYADNICSESSRELVSEHIEQCESCRQELEDYCYNVGISDEVDEKKIITDFGKKLKRKRIGLALISVIVSICSILNVSYVLFVPETTMSYTEGLLTVQANDDGSIDVLVNSENYKKVDYRVWGFENGEIFVFLKVNQNAFYKLFKNNELPDIAFHTDGSTFSSQSSLAIYEWIYENPKVTRIYYTEMDWTEFEDAMNLYSGISGIEDKIDLVWSAY